MNYAVAAGSTLSINELASAHKVSPAAVRYYERRGLFDERHVSRAPNGYRRFTPLASERLHLIKLGQLAGFSLREMTTELTHWDDGTLSVEEKKTILQAQLIRLREKIDTLRDVEQFIEREIAKAC